MPFSISGFADEIDPSLEVQLETLNRLNIPGLDLRGVDGVNVLDITTDDLFRIGETCREAGVHIQSIGSPVNKIKYDVMHQARELDKLDRAIRAARHLNVQRIRVFTPEAEPGQEEEAGAKILAWMHEHLNKATENGITLIVENDGHYWSAYPDNAKRMFDMLGGPNFKAVFDFANSALIGYRPVPDWFPWLLPHLDTLHIKDAVRETGKIVPAGQGNGEIEETLKWLIEQGWSGPLTIEPHLQAAGPFGGFSGPDLFGEAVKALRGITQRLGVEV